MGTFSMVRLGSVHSWMLTLCLVAAQVSLPSQHRVNFDEVLTDAVLGKHRIKKYEGKTCLALCGAYCHHEPTCMSFNMIHPSLVCELSSGDRHSHPGDMRRRGGASYHGMAATSHPGCWGYPQDCKTRSKSRDGLWTRWREWSPWSSLNGSAQFSSQARECAGPFHAGLPCEGSSERHRFRESPTLERLTPIAGSESSLSSRPHWNHQTLYDGNVNPDVFGGGCFHVGGPDYAGGGWVEVYLDRKYWIASLSVLTRGDCCHYLSVQRAVGMQLWVCQGTGGESCNLCGRITEASRGQWRHFTCPSLMLGGTVRLTHPSNILELCELHVYGLVYP